MPTAHPGCHTAAFWRKAFPGRCMGCSTQVCAARNTWASLAAMQYHTLTNTLMSNLLLTPISLVPGFSFPRTGCAHSHLPAGTAGVFRADCQLAAQSVRIASPHPTHKLALGLWDPYRAVSSDSIIIFPFHILNDIKGDLTSPLRHHSEEIFITDLL